MAEEPELVVHQCRCAACQAGSEPQLARHHHQINLLLSRMSEPQRRWYVASLAEQPHAPSISDLARITGLDRNTIARGRRELRQPFRSSGRVRRPGAGGQCVEKKVLGS